jgi:hypothetical protein
MKLKDYSQMIGFLTRDKTTDVPGSMAHGLRTGFYDGGRAGFRKAGSVQKMSVSDALEEIFDLGSDTSKTQFLDREELKELVEEKIGTKINKNILKTSRYPILNYVEYDTSKLMK